MTRLAQTWWSVLRGRRFLSRWSLWGTLPVAVTVMGAYFGSDGGRPGALFVVSAASWVVAVAVLWPLARWVARWAHPTGRAVAVAVVVTVLAGTRPLLLDALCGMVGAIAAPPEWLPFRVATNLVVWWAVLSVLALLAETVRERRIANRRLAVLAADFASIEHEGAERARAVQRLVEECRGELVSEAAHLDPERGEAVARFSQRVREWSHRFAQQAEAARNRRADPHPADATPRGGGRLPGAMLRVPPVGAVSALWALLVLPYAVRQLPPATLAVSCLLLIGGGLAIDVAVRRRRIRAVNRVAVLLALWSVAGVVLALLVLLGSGAPLRYAWVSALALPLVALVLCRCTGLVHGLGLDGRRLETMVRERQRSLAAANAEAHRVAEATSRRLHGAVQAACVRMLASVGGEPAEATLLELREALAPLGAAVVPAVHSGAAPLDAVLHDWARVVPLMHEISPEARELLEAAPGAAAGAAEVVTEGLVNAVKHAAAPQVRVSVTRVQTAAGVRLDVEVVSAGVLPAGAALRGDAPVALIGAELGQRGGDVVLRASLAVPAVVPTAHSADPFGATR